MAAIRSSELLSVASHLPETVVTSEELEQILNDNSRELDVQSGIIEAATGVRERRVAAQGVDASDLAHEAAVIALERAAMQVDELDLIIFAAASLDLVEPATANILQEKLGATCPVFDVKNACNSFLNAVQIADSLIASGVYDNVLVAVGEVPSRGVKLSIKNRDDFRRSFIGFAVGDAGAAAIISVSERPSILHCSFKTVGAYWDAAAVLGGGSMFQSSPEHAYLQGDPARLQVAFRRDGPGILQKALSATHTNLENFKRILVHQVSQSVLDSTASFAGLPLEKIETTLPSYGNIASASLPVAYDAAMSRGVLERGDLVMWIGLAAGVSMGVMVTQVF